MRPSDSEDAFLSRALCLAETGVESAWGIVFPSNQLFENGIESATGVWLRCPG